ncbi:PIG-L deacetylase family protein [Pseudofrankia sp. BMG5.36]|uniref:PIG-L deacetylase family protein n=1 Tax=Pseudofrankia sp. BMG5.36 TaxID=1834512 RepID=UPI0008D93B49|nr:PIG-L deacetylase family protein [Pseudofrankia sp. BMG5.36]OHV63682.1 GlcNAc-PI de-N-acetylase [Pseudofrankia sp. BMG5.36]
MSRPGDPRRPGTLLAVMAHPDDAELWAGGTIALHAEAAQATIAIPPAEPARLAEATAGADTLGAHLHILDAHPIAEAISALIARLRPEIVVTHPATDVHPHHRGVAEAVLAAVPDAVISTGFPRRLYSCDSYNSLTLAGPVPAATIIDITTTYSTKMRALAAHSVTQPINDHFGPMADTLARLWGARIGTQYAELFTPIPLLGRLPGATQL